MATLQEAQKEFKDVRNKAKQLVQNLENAAYEVVVNVVEALEGPVMEWSGDENDDVEEFAVEVEEWLDNFSAQLDDAVTSIDYLQTAVQD